MTISELQTELQLKCNITSLCLQDKYKDVSIVLLDNNNCSVVGSFKISDDIIYNFDFNGSFETLKKVVYILEGYQDGKE